MRLLVGHGSVLKHSAVGKKACGKSKCACVNTRNVLQNSRMWECETLDTSSGALHNRSWPWQSLHHSPHSVGLARQSAAVTQSRSSERCQAACDPPQMCKPASVLQRGTCTAVCTDPKGQAVSGQAIRVDRAAHTRHTATHRKAAHAGWGTGEPDTPVHTAGYHGMQKMPRRPRCGAGQTGATTQATR